MISSLASISQARAAAERLLRFRPRSEQELRQRLRQKGFEAPIVETLVQELARKDLLNDQKFAQYVATNRLAMRPTGVRALRDELRRKGVAAPVAEAALAKATVGYDEAAAARELAQRRAGQMSGLPAATIQRRLFGLLQRRGFSGEVVHRVVREVVRTTGEAS